MALLSSQQSTDGQVQSMFLLIFGLYNHIIQALKTYYPKCVSILSKYIYFI